MNRQRIALFVTIIIALNGLSCGALQQLGQAVTNISRCSFKLAGISDFKLAGIAISGKTSFTTMDAVQGIAAFGRGELPASFNLNVAAINPNDGTGGTKKSTATLTSFAWNLRIDDTPTIAGDIAQPIEIPATGQQTVIPLRMNLDLMKFFKDRGYEKIVNLAFALGGAQGTTSRVTLRAKPTMKTSFGPLTYPGEIDIIDKEFRTK